MPTTNKPQAVGYIRVSGKHQIKGESLEVQEKDIKKYAEYKGFTYLKTYKDEALSGADKDRPELNQLKSDAQAGQFKHVIVWRLDRFGRNAVDLQLNFEFLQQYDVKFYSVKEQMDFSSTHGKFYLQMLAAIAELESNNIKERSIAGRINLAEKGYPPSQKLPYGRTFDRKTNTWGLDKNKVDIIKEAYQRYVKDGESLMDIAKDMKGRGLDIVYDKLRRTLRDRCGKTWEYKFEMLEKPIIIKIPHILEQDEITEIHKTLNFNRRTPRTDAAEKKVYLLSGFIYCGRCGRSLTGQIQHHNSKYRYYYHCSRKDDPCNPKPFNTVLAEKIEQVVFDTMFVHFFDEVGFNKAIESNFDIEKQINKLYKEIADYEKSLGRVNRNLEKIRQMRYDDKQPEEELDKDERKFRADWDWIKEKLDQLYLERNRIPSKEEIQKRRKKSGEIRQELMKKYKSPDRWKEMDFEEKRKLLKRLFDSKEHGVFVYSKNHIMIQMNVLGLGEPIENYKTKINKVDYQ